MNEWEKYQSRAKAIIHNTKRTGSGKHYPRYNFGMYLNSRQMDMLRDVVQDRAMMKTKEEFKDQAIQQVFALLEAAIISARVIPYDPDKG